MIDNVNIAVPDGYSSKSSNSGSSLTVLLYLVQYLVHTPTVLTAPLTNILSVGNGQKKSYQMCQLINGPYDY